MYPDTDTAELINYLYALRDNQTPECNQLKFLISRYIAEINHESWMTSMVRVRLFNVSCEQVMKQFKRDQRKYDF